MNDNTNKTLQLVDQFAQAAHAIVDQLQNSAVSIESIIGKQSQETGDSIKAGISREASELEKYVDQNPEISAMIAFAIGVAATRFLEPKEAGGMTSSADLPEVKTTKVA